MCHRGLVLHLLSNQKIKKVSNQKQRIFISVYHHMMLCLDSNWQPEHPFLLTLRVLCRARSVCAFSLMMGFLLRRMNDFLKWSCVSGCSWPIKETPPSFMLFNIMLISSTGVPFHKNRDTDRKENKSKKGSDAKVTEERDGSE